MTGTPLQNSHEDIFAYLHFLRHKTYGSEQSFKQLFSGRNRFAEGLQQLKDILQPIMLRRTKESQIDGVPILSLPGRCI